MRASAVRTRLRKRVGETPTSLVNARLSLEGDTAGTSANGTKPAPATRIGARHSTDRVFLGDGGPVRVGFQRVADYHGPDWPNERTYTHLDFVVEDVERTTETLLEPGASKPDFQPGGDKWTVLTDPEGHPFCLTRAE